MIKSKAPAFACDQGVTLGGLVDGGFVWVDGALKAARPIAAKKRIGRGDLEMVLPLEAAAGRVFTGFNDLCSVLCGVESCVAGSAQPAQSPSRDC
jgi:hypothetical protein